MKKTEITISPNGEVKIETKGFSGEDCIKETTELEKALGIKLSDKKTSEYYKISSTQTQEQKA